jgi:hypothetical protein
MKQLRSSRHLIRMWHRREKATIDHLARAVAPEAKADAAAAVTVHSAFTPSGLAVEDQLRKIWQPAPIGLAMF